jgi:predicted Zn-dependent peptidase
MREKADLVQKLKADNDKADRVIRDLARQSDFNQMELEKIKDEIEAERRRTVTQ